MNLKLVVIVVIVVALLVSPVLATSVNETASRTVTANGPSGILIPLGFENYVSSEQAFIYYNWISLATLGILAGVASIRTMRFIIVLIPITAAMLAFFGWFSDHTTAGGQAALWGKIIFLGFFAGIVYMKEQNRAAFGTGGPGLSVMNIAVFLILLQASVGLVNGFNLFPDGNMAQTPEAYQNVDLGTQIVGINDSGGFFGDIISMGNALFTAGIAGLKGLVSIVVSIVFFSVVVYSCFPFLQGNSMVILMLAAMQVIIWVLYALFVFNVLYLKNPDSVVI